MTCVTPNDPKRPSRRAFLGAATAALAFRPTWSSAGMSHVPLAEFAAKRGGSLRVLIPVGSKDNLLPVAAQFHRQAGIDIDFIEGDVREIGNMIIVGETLGDGSYDAALPATFEIPDLAATEAIHRLDTLAPGAPTDEEKQGEIYPEGNSFEGATYGYQTDGDTYLAFYNGRMLNDARFKGMYEDRFNASLEVPRTWEEYDRQVAFFGGQDGLYGSAMSHHAGYVESEFWVRMHAKGLWPLSDTLEPQFTSDAGVEAVEDLIRASEVSLIPENGQSDLVQTWMNFDTATAYASLGWGGSQKYYRRSGAGFVDDILHAPLPGAPGANTPKSMSYFNWGWSYVVPKGARDPELAHAFCRFAVTPSMSLEAVRQVGGFFDPFRESHYSDGEIRAIYGDAFLKVHEVSLRESMPDFYLARRNDYFQSLGTWLEHAVMRRITPEQALQRAADAWTLTTITSGADRQAQRWSELRRKYPPALQSYLKDL